MTLNILVTVDSNYVMPLKTMLFSLFISNPHTDFRIILLYSDLRADEISELERYTALFRQKFLPVKAVELPGVPAVSYYTRTMYHRLLAYEILPQEIDRALYLDPDILVINPVESLYTFDLGNKLWAACSHAGPIVDGINRARLQMPEEGRYFNSGVLLMDLRMQRKELTVSDIFDYVNKYQNRLLLPDQDILNGLYSDRILELNELLYNYDVRKRRRYFLASKGEADDDWITTHTVVLHFCGKHKPWHKNYYGHFSFMYKYCMNLAALNSSALTKSPIVFT
ncbi:MAG: glycosyltransferase family 8 protein [Spirochaetaceae bacterium]|jgi:lipopolysaccharide biosynthesis glycosyltransferase|nr:glycosyltransferase family 8 protein [Spirochaetaceae bacterium]